MKIALSAATLLLVANLPYVALIIRHRRELPINWQSGVLLVLRNKIRSGLWFALQLIAVLLAVFYYLFNRISYLIRRGDAGFVLPCLMIVSCIVGVFVLLNWLDALGLNRY
jgi:hypothetical protein